MFRQPVPGPVQLLIVITPCGSSNERPIEEFFDEGHITVQLRSVDGQFGLSAHVDAETARQLYAEIMRLAGNAKAAGEVAKAAAALEDAARTQPDLN